MPKNILVYHDTKLIKSKTRKKRFGLWFFIVLMTAFVVMIASLFGNYFSFDFLNFIGVGANQINKHSYYGVSMGKFDNLNDAENLASAASVVGAGSYVWFYNNSYYVLGSVYENFDDAEVVKNNISNQNFEIEVVEIVYNKIDFKIDTLNTDQQKMLLNAASNLSNVYKTVYDYSVKFDKNEIVSPALSSQLNTLKSELVVTSSSLDALNSVAVCDQTLIVKNAYVSVINELDGAVLSIIDGKSISKDLKYLASAVAVFKQNMFNLISAI